MIEKIIEKGGINPFFGDFAGAFDGFGEDDDDDDDDGEAIKISATRKQVVYN